MSSEHLQTLCLPLWPPCCWLAQVSPPQDAVTVGFHQLLAFLLYFLLVLSYLLNTLHSQGTVQGFTGVIGFQGLLLQFDVQSLPRQLDGNLNTLLAALSSVASVAALSTNQTL